jgi:hypothetical protein
MDGNGILQAVAVAGADGCGLPASTVFVFDALDFFDVSVAFEVDSSTSVEVEGFEGSATARACSMLLSPARGIEAVIG